MPEAVLCHATRTPTGRFGGTLKTTPAPDLGARIVRETLRRSGVAAGVVDGLVFGEVVTAGSA